MESTDSSFQFSGKLGSTLKAGLDLFPEHRRQGITNNLVEEL